MHQHDVARRNRRGRLRLRLNCAECCRERGDGERDHDPGYLHRTNSMTKFFW